MLTRARMSKKTGQCRCLKCCVRRAVNDYYVRQHGDEPGEVIMSMDETMAALVAVLSEIVSAIPDLRERMEVCCEFANTVLAWPTSCAPTAGSRSPATTRTSRRGWCCTER